MTELCRQAHINKQTLYRERRRISPEGSGDPDADTISIGIVYMQQASHTVYRQWVTDGKRMESQRLEDLAARMVARGAEGALY